MLHAELYRAEAVEEAGRAFSEHCQTVVSREESYLRVDLTATGDQSEERLAGELANYALALTVEMARNEE